MPPYRRLAIVAPPPGLTAGAAAYLDLALSYAKPSQPRLIAIGGLSGTGKSSVAKALAPKLGPAPGAVVLRSDVLRKQLAGVGEQERLPSSSYTAAAAKRRKRGRISAR